MPRTSDRVIAGEQAAGTGWAHYAYIAADVALLGLLVALVVVTARELLPVRASQAPTPVRPGVRSR